MALAKMATFNSGTTPSEVSPAAPSGAQGRGVTPAPLGAGASIAAAPSCNAEAQEPPGSAPLGLAGPDWGSPGLGGLAAALASQGEDRLALQAVVSALLSAGVGEPTDLALVGRGDLLPQDTVESLKVSRCPVPQVHWR